MMMVVYRQHHAALGVGKGQHRSVGGAGPVVLVMMISIEHRETNVPSTLMQDEQTVS